MSAAAPAQPPRALRLVLKIERPARALALLDERCGLPREALRECMARGGVWLRRPGRREMRLRDAHALLRSGDRIEVCYDQAVLERRPVPGRCLVDRGAYSVWYKPPGLLAQGSRFGDHCALSRQAELELSPPRPVHLVQRLDREAAGLMVLAHDPGSARRLAAALQSEQAEKGYRAQVRGRLEGQGRIDLPLDGRPALTEYRALAYDPAADVSTLAVRILSGRLHQIRRHLEAVGHPVMGDPRYGQGNKNREGLRLVAVALGFACPVTGRPVTYRLDPELAGF
jgi:tRNA pseudouridine32 synthase/23S rRNA pseudouridine746 synthase